MISGSTASTTLGLLGRILPLFIRRHPEKRFEATLSGRGHIIETPYGLPFQVLDLEGNTIRHGIYVLGIRLWNRGTLPVSSADFTSPLRIELGTAARVLGSDVATIVDELECTLSAPTEHSIEVTHNGFNAGDDAVVAIYFTSSDPNVPVKVSGRILGQTAPLDRTDNESRAGIRERVAVALILIWSALSLPCALISGYLIVSTYGWGAFISEPPGTAGRYLMALFAFSCIIPMLWLTLKASRFLERRKLPRGYPLDTDFEPPPMENLRNLIKMVFFGNKYRISTSIFSPGHPVVFVRRIVRKRSVNDWLK